MFEKELCLKSTDLGNDTDPLYCHTFEGPLYFGFFFFLLEVSMSHLPQGRGWGEEAADWSQKVLDLVSGGLAPGT